MDFKWIIVEELIKVGLPLEEEYLYRSIEVPPNKEMGDYSFPCFRLAKEFRKSPQLIAEELAEKIENKIFNKVVTAGPYINFYLDSANLAQVTLEEIYSKGYDYGKSDMGKGKTVIVEYSSTNIAKPFHIGHIRSTVQGDALKRIHKYLGYDTIAINYLGDHGTQFGILISAYKKWGDKEKINKNPIQELLNLYVRYNSEADKDPSLMDQARDWFYRLEKGDEEALELWTWFKEISLKEFERVYDLLDVEFDSYDGEHFHSQFIPNLLDEMNKKSLLEESEGAQIVNLEDKNLPPAIIVKSNKSSTYITRDIATAIYRKKKYDFDENIYVVATQQNLHFKQLKAILDKMDYTWADKCEHVAFGMVSLEDGTMSTRKGKVIFLEDVLNQSIDKTLEIINERNPNLKNKERIAKEIGIGAIKFQELFNNRIKDYVFDWDEILNFEGETGPYVQYTHARANGILSRYEGDISSDIDYSLFKTQEELDLIMSLYNFPQVIIDAKTKYEPSLITRYMAELSKNFNKFYNTCPILNSDEEIKKARILLVYASKVTISRGLNLLGISSPNEM